MYYYNGCNHYNVINDLFSFIILYYKYHHAYRMFT